jgi:AcrR family transcriptional regulator
MAVARTAEDLRRDLAGGLAAAITDKGYPATTIADIVSRARVSKRTFYEHFADKEACLMALYEQSSDDLSAAVERAVSEAPEAASAIRDGVNAYLAGLQTMPAVARTLLVEIQATGPSAFQLRQRMLRRFADTLVALVAKSPELPPLTPDLAIALVGGINELTLQLVDPYAGSDRSFTALTATVERLVHAVLSAGIPSGMPVTPGELSTG